MGGVAPTARSQHSCVMAGSKMIIFGGWDGEKALSDLHVLDTGTTPPPDCLLHSSVTAELTSMRVAGRVRVRVRWCVRVRSCRAEKWVWEKVKTSGCMPQARYGHSAAYLRYDHPTLSALMRFPPKISLTPRVRVRVRVRCRVSCVR